MDELRIAVVGAGASGLMAAASITSGHVTVYDHMGRVGRKLSVTGGGRCNLTNNCTVSEFLSHVVRNPRFLYSSLNAFSPSDTISFFEELGVKTKVEDEGRVFPVSNRAEDVVSALYERCRSRGVKFVWQRVLGISAEGGRDFRVLTEDGAVYYDRVIVASGGMVPRSLGSLGDGYSFARELGIKVNEPAPSLLPLRAGKDLSALSGVSLHGVRLTLFADSSKKALFSGVGEMMFTHDGLTGPIVLSSSAHLEKNSCHTVSIDFLPDMKRSELGDYLTRRFSESGGKNILTALKEICPASVMAVIIGRAGGDVHERCANVTRGERERLADMLKGFELAVTGTAPQDAGMVTRGGIDVSEVSPKTMESLKVPGLYFCGEVLDVDAYTGGYNLQIAFSTGRAAALAVSLR